MPTQWKSAPAAITTSASRSVIPCSATIAGRTPRRKSRRARRSAMFVTIWMWTHEWSVSDSRCALIPAMCHHALTWGSALTASRSCSRRRLPRVGARMRTSAIASAGSMARDGSPRRRPAAGSRLRRAEYPEPLGGHAGLATRAGAELAQHRRDVVIDRLHGHDEPLRDLGVAQALRDQAHDLELAWREAGRVLARPRTRPSQQPADGLLAQAPHDVRRRRARPQRLELVQGLAQRARVVAVRKRERGLVATAELPPPPRGFRPLACERQRERLGGRAGRKLFAHAGAPPPARQLSRKPRRLTVERERERERCVGLALDRRIVGGEPRRLGAGRRVRRDAVDLSRRLREGAFLGARPGPLRVAAASPDEPERGQRRPPRKWGAPRVAHDERGGVGGVVPAIAVKFHASAPGEQVQPPRVQPALEAVLESRLEVRVGDAEPALSYRTEHDAREGPARLI